MNLDIKDIKYMLNLNSDASILDVRNKLRSTYYYHCSMNFSSECWNADEQQSYINSDEEIIRSFNSLVSDSDKINL